MGIGKGEMMDRLPGISKNTILRDKVNDVQTALAKQGPMMIRNPKKIEKEGRPLPSILGG
jgi:hypothetical protein